MPNGAGCPIRARACPSGRRRAVGELDQVERVLDVRVELVDRHELAGVELAGHAAVEDRQRLGADVLRQLEVLEEAQAERLVVVRRRPVHELVVPAVDDERAGPPTSPIVFFHWYRDSRSRPSTMQPPGKRRKPGFSVREHLAEVLAEPVRPVLAGLAGKSETMSRSMAPVPSTISANRAPGLRRPSARAWLRSAPLPPKPSTRRRAVDAPAGVADLGAQRRGPSPTRRATHRRTRTTCPPRRPCRGSRRSPRRSRVPSASRRR